MRKAKYTDEDIIATGKLLQGEGKEVNANAIKLRLGGGKATRIGGVWNAYLANNAAVPSQESPLKKPIDPDENKFAFQVALPIKNAASKVEGVFEQLLDQMSEKAESRLEQLLEREEERHRQEEAELTGQLQSTERRLEREEKGQRETLQQLMAANKKIESLEASIESMSKQIDKLKERKPT
jgi:hypothetical protein